MCKIHAKRRLQANTEILHEKWYVGHVKYGSKLLKGKYVDGQRSMHEKEGVIHAPYTTTTRREAGPTKRNRRVKCAQGAHLREGGTAQGNLKRKNVLYAQHRVRPNKGCTQVH